MGADGPDILSVENLCVDIRGAGGSRTRVVDGVSLTLGQGEIVALVGESGSGKTMIGRALLRLLPPVASVSGGALLFKGRDLLSLPASEMRGLRGRRIGMVFQEPMTSLNPSLKVGVQMAEALRLHAGLSRAEARRHGIAMLKRVKIADPERSFDAYPHQFSGGMRQRIMLASVLALRPELLIADEPTTALDAVIQNEILELMIELTREIGTAVLLVSHDLGVVAEYANSVAVLRQGSLIESGPPSEILLRPQHPYTRDLMAALPERPRDDGAEQALRHSLVKVENLCVDFRRKGFSLRPGSDVVRAVDDVSFSVGRGEVLAVVGESGSGKTTIGRALMRLCTKASGRIRFGGLDFDTLDKRGAMEMCGAVQMIFQDPFSSLDPRMTLEAIVAENLRRDQDLGRAERLARAREALQEVGLPESFMNRYPHELSGGQRQRVCIARAIVARPSFIVADEPVSALDPTIQKQVLTLLAGLQEKYGFSFLFISHDLGVVEQVADRVIVMYRGRILEIGPRDAIYDTPRHPYTIRLLEATPRLARRPDGSYVLKAPPVRRAETPKGYGFFNNGSMPEAPLSAGAPVLVEVGPTHFLSCVRQ